jgi:hypothetical protein
MVSSPMDNIDKALGMIRVLLQGEGGTGFGRGQIREALREVEDLFVLRSQEYE